MIKSLTCIICPIGCKLEIEIVDGDIKSISGNGCKRGEVYAKAEINAPVRTLTTTILADNSKVLPVKTNKPIPKDLIFDCMKIINSNIVSLPVNIGSVIIENISNTGADIISTKNMR